MLILNIKQSSDNDDDKSIEEVKSFINNPDKFIEDVKELYNDYLSGEGNNNLRKVVKDNLKKGDQNSKEYEYVYNFALLIQNNVYNDIIENNKVSEKNIVGFLKEGDFKAVKLFLENGGEINKLYKLDEPLPFIYVNKRIKLLKESLYNVNNQNYKADLSEEQKKKYKEKLDKFINLQDLIRKYVKFYNNVNLVDYKSAENLKNNGIKFEIVIDERFQDVFNNQNTYEGLKVFLNYIDGLFKMNLKDLQNTEYPVYIKSEGQVQELDFGDNKQVRKEYKLIRGGKATKETMMKSINSINGGVPFDNIKFRPEKKEQLKESSKTSKFQHIGEDVYPKGAYIYKDKQTGQEYEIITTYDILDLAKLLKQNFNNRDEFYESFEEHNENILEHIEYDENGHMVGNLASDYNKVMNSIYESLQNNKKNNTKNVILDKNEYIDNSSNRYGGRYFFLKKDLNKLLELKQKQHGTARYNGHSQYGIFINVENIEIYDKQEGHILTYTGDIQIFHDDNELGFGILKLCN